MTQPIRQELCDYQRAMVRTYDRLCQPSDLQKQHDQTAAYHGASLYGSTTDREATAQFCKALKPSVEGLRNTGECCTHVPNRVASTMDVARYVRGAGEPPPETVCAWPGMLPRGD